MDATPAPTAPSPPRSSKKRSSRPKPHAGHPVPNPSPLPAAVAVAVAATSSSRNRERERKRRQRSAFADPATAATAVTAPAPAPGGGGGVQKQLWSDADVVALLDGAAAFRARTGRVPRFPDMAALYDSIRGSLSPHIDQAKVYYKLKRIKGKYLHAAPGAAAGPHERRVRDLCASVWGADLEPLAAAAVAAAEQPRAVPDAAAAAAAASDQPRSVPDAAAMLPVLTEMLDEYWKTDGRTLSGVALEKGLSLLGTGEARFIESKWRRQLDSEIQTQMRRHDLAKEVYALLMDAIKGLGP
uniref:Glabrous enhancer-binding protein-like DBD domain-containing protein n=1 Tax=Leersia perrieri TaxID=77586 RepID=A0A0D9VLI4_9ORYZ